APEPGVMAARYGIAGVDRAGVAVVARRRFRRLQPLDGALVAIPDHESAARVDGEVERPHALRRVGASVAAGIEAVGIGRAACKRVDRPARGIDLADDTQAREEQVTTRAGGDRVYFPEAAGRGLLPVGDRMLAGGATVAGDCGDRPG